MKSLITYHVSTSWNHPGTFNYQVVDSVTDWIENTQRYKDETYVLINVLPITDEQAGRYDGNLKSM